MREFHIIHTIEAIPVIAIPLFMNDRIGDGKTGTVGWPVGHTGGSSIASGLAHRKVIASACPMITCQSIMPDEHGIFRFKADERLMCRLELILLNGIVIGFIPGEGAVGWFVGIFNEFCPAGIVVIVSHKSKIPFQ